MKFTAKMLLSSTLVLATCATVFAKAPAGESEGALNSKINEAEKAGSLSHEQANQLRIDEQKITQKEEKLRKKHSGNLTSKDEDSLQKDRTALNKKLNKVVALKEDNTGKNLGDQRPESPTPEKQSNKKSDVQMTADIRKKLMDDKAMSTNAKNAKIITINGVVTLRGVVDSADEKEKIFAAARECAGGGKVLNELEVKASK